MIQENKLEQSSHKGTKRGSLLNEFFWICSGANRDILRQCPTEYSKYFGIGGTIFFTAAMAALSGGYAFNTIFKDNLLALCFGIFWGLLIFNLDRFIVNTMYSDGKHTISWSEFKSGFPRIIIAVFLGIVISTPLELKIFEDEINVKIDEMIEIKLDEYVRKDSLQLVKLGIEKDTLYKRINQFSNLKSSKDIFSEQQENLQKQRTEAEENQNILGNELKDLQNDLNLKSSSLNQINKKLKSESDSIKRIDLEKKKKGLNNSIKRLKAEIKRKNDKIEIYESQLEQLSQNNTSIIQERFNQNQEEYARLIKQYDELSRKIADLESKITNARVSYKDKLDNEFRGFQAHMLAFGLIKDENMSTRIVALFIMFLFIIIETAPTIFKMMIESGPYDELLKEEMERTKATAIVNVSKINADANTQIQISIEKNKEKLLAEVAANKEVLSKVAAVQAELLQVAIEEWRKEELAKIKESPSKYIHSNIKKS